MPEPLPRCARLNEVERTAGRSAEFLDHVGVDHRRLDVGVSEVLLDLPDVHAVQQEMGGETVTEGVNGDGLVDARLLGGRPDRFLDD